MEAVGNYVVTDNIKKLIQQSTDIFWCIGDELVKLQNDEEPGFSPIRRACEDARLPLATAQAMKIYKTAATFSKSQRGYGLPFCMYSYAVTRTSDPSSWIDKAYEDKMTPRELYSAVRKFELDKKKGKEFDEYEQLLSVPVGSKARVIAYYHFTSELCEPYIRVKMIEDCYSIEEAGALRDAIDRCIGEISDALGDEDLSAICNSSNFVLDMEELAA